MGLWEILKGEEPGIIRYYLNFENLGQYGEYATEFALTNNNIYGKFEVLKNVYVPYKEKTAEIDLIMIHEKGIYVFESKNYSGWIFGDENQLNWVQSLPNGEKSKFYNPIRQNQTHIKALSECLELPISAFKSYIIFSNRCTLKKVPKSTDSVIIVKREDMLNNIRADLKRLPVIYNDREIQHYKYRLIDHTNKSSEDKEKHIDNIKNKCPYCGSDLILRKGKHGEFYGCSAYPKCKFTKKL